MHNDVEIHYEKKENDEVENREEKEERNEHE